MQDEVSILTRRRLLRQRALHARETLDVGLRADIEKRLVHHVCELLTRLAPQVLAFCWPYRAEPDLRETVAGWLAEDASRRAALPVVLDTNRALTFRRWKPEMLLEPDRHGIPQPPHGCEELTPDVLLIPLNAFDAQGYRLGYGGGYFDRTLEVLPATAVGVGFELGRADNVLPQPHDRAMNWIVTERGVFQCPVPEENA